MIYVTSDIHGEYELFISLLKEINFNKQEDRLFILGDVVDRGKDSIKTLQYIYENKDSIILLKGNHEDMMIDAITTNNYHMWFHNGGRFTNDGYERLNVEEQKLMFDYIKDLPCLLQTTVNDKKFILSHAGVETDHNGYIFPHQDQDFLLWSREEFLFNTEIANDVICIVGHTPIVNLHRKDTIWHSDCSKKICVDCGAVFGYKLACLRLDDMEEFYVSKV